MTFLETQMTWLNHQRQFWYYNSIKKKCNSDNISSSSPSLQDHQAVLSLRSSLVAPVRNSHSFIILSKCKSQLEALHRLCDQLTLGPISPSGPVVPGGPAGPCGNKTGASIKRLRAFSNLGQTSESDIKRVKRTGEKKQVIGRKFGFVNIS